MAKFKNEAFAGLNLEAVDEDALPLARTVDEAAFTRARVLEDQQSSKFFTSLGNSIQEEWIAPNVYNNFERIVEQDGTPVETFTEELVRQLTEGLDDRQAVREVLEEAQTNGLSKAMKTREAYLRTQANLQQIQADGWSGVTANTLAAMFDPVEWGAIIGTSAAVGAINPLAGGGTFLVGAGNKARKAYRAAQVAAIAGGEAALFESVRAAYRYDVDAGDVILAGGLGAALGGGIDAATTAFIRAGHRNRIAAKVAKGEELTEAEQRFFDEYNVEALAVKMIDREIADDSLVDSVDGLPTFTPEARGAQDVSDEEVAAIPKQAGVSMKGLREFLSVGARMANSDIGWARYTARALGLNSTGYKGGTLETNMSASEWAELYQMRYRNKMAKILPHAQKIWSKRTGQSISQFNNLVSRYVRGIDTDGVDPEVAKVGDFMRKTMDEIAEEAVANDVSGFSMDMLRNHNNYMTRLFDDEKIRQLRIKLGDEADLKIAQLVEEAIRRGQPNIEENVKQYLTKKLKGTKQRVTKKKINNYIRQMATGYMKGITDPSLGKKGLAGGGEHTLEDIGDLMKVGGIPQEDIDAVVDILTRTNVPKAHKRARHRMVLDEGAMVRLQNADGSIEEYRFADLLEEDAEQLFNTYVFQLSGAIGLARNGIDTNRAGSGFQDLVQKIKDEGRKNNVPKDEIDKQVKAAEYMYDGITGRLAQRQDVSNRARDMNIAVRAFSFAVNMGMSGMSALMEISNAMFEYGITTVLKSNPAYRALINKLSSGQVDDKLMDELIEAFGLGEEVALGKWNNVTRMDTESSTDSLSPERSWVEKRGWSSRNLRGGVAQTAQRQVAYWSGLTGVTQTLRRMSMRHFTNEWSLAARKGKLPFSEVKRKQLGLSDDMAGRIRDILASEVVEKNADGTVRKLNLSQWPRDVRESFQAAGFKEARQNVQEANIASTNEFLRTELGKTMFQFLNFTMASMEQQTQRLGVRIMKGDIAVAKVLVSAGLMGSLMYATRVHMNAMGRSDADEYIKEQMSGGKLFTGALSQIGAASIFSYILQLTTGGMQGNAYAITPPSVSIGQNILSSVGNLIEENEMTETEWRTLLRILPYQSMYGARQLLNGTANALADYFD